MERTTRLLLRLGVVATAIGLFVMASGLLAVSARPAVAGARGKAPDDTWLRASPTPTPTLWLPLVARDYCPPGIEFTTVPPRGSFADLRGRVSCVRPADHRVAVFIYVYGWWTKPYWAQPLTPIRSDGTWTADITTGGVDETATRIIAFLVPAGYAPPLMSGQPDLPGEIFDRSRARVEALRP